MPINDHAINDEILKRQSDDNMVNSFGRRLISLCKEKSVNITNGRLESGKCTFRGTLRGRHVSSVTDYILTNMKNFDDIVHMNVNDITEFSDHNLIEFTMKCNKSIDRYEETYENKLHWDTARSADLIHELGSKRINFDSILHDINTDVIDVDNGIRKLNDLIINCSYKVFGRTVKKGINRTFPSKQRSKWFNNECKQAKAEFLITKRELKRCNSDVNNHNYNKARQEYRKIKRVAKAKYLTHEQSLLSDLSKNNTKQFWKKINEYKNTRKVVYNDKSLHDFANYFKELSNTSNSNVNILNEEFDEVDHNISIDELDKPFDIDEISRVIISLKRNKSSGFDNIAADFFIDARYFIVLYLVHLFNKIFDNGVYPELWTKGMIVPIYKKGDKNNVANYRGITLINSMAKIFSLTLRTRLNKWCEDHNVLSDSQFGFRNNRSTTDSIFILHIIIQKILSQKSKLYCAFIDYEKAFDTVIRDGLWVKLFKCGISSKMIAILKSIYSVVKSCVRYCGDLSDFFDVSLGVKQGEPLSPLLFILFINDVQDNINVNNLSEYDINQLCIFLLLFADDIVLFTTNPRSLQLQLNSLYEFSQKWGLKINTKNIL